MALEQDFTKFLLAELKRLAKINKFKYSPRFYGIYSVNDESVWRVRLIPGFLLSDNTFDVQLIVSIGATCFDSLLASIVNPEEEVCITELHHVAGIYVGPSMNITKKTYIFQFDNDVCVEEKARDAATMILSEAIKKMSEFENCVMSEHTDLVSYMMSLKESNPMECGMAYLSKKEYQFAYDCFKYAADNKKNWPISYGSKARMLHLILMDYCNAMQKGIEWKDEYVVNGLCNE